MPLFRYEKFWLPLIAELSDSELRDLDYAPPMGESVYPTIMILFIRDWRFELVLSRLGTRDMLHFQHTVPKITCPDGADETVQYTVLGPVYTIRYSTVCFDMHSSAPFLAGLSLMLSFRLFLVHCTYTVAWKVKEGKFWHHLVPLAAVQLYTVQYFRSKDLGPIS